MCGLIFKDKTNRSQMEKRMNLKKENRKEELIGMQNGKIRKIARTVRFKKSSLQNFSNNPTPLFFVFS